MTARNLIAAVFTAAALSLATAGCDDKKPTPKVDDAKPGAAMPSVDAMKEKAAAAADATKDATAKAMAKTKEEAAKVAEVTKDATVKTVDATKDATAKTVDAAKNTSSTAADKTAAATASAPDKVADATAAGSAKATEWMDHLDASIKANRLDEAKTYTDKLDAIQTSFSDTLRERYAALKKSLDEARAKAATQLNK